MESIKTQNWSDHKSFPIPKRIQRVSIVLHHYNYTSNWFVFVFNQSVNRSNRNYIIAILDLHYAVFRVFLVP